MSDVMLSKLSGRISRAFPISFSSSWNRLEMCSVCTRLHRQLPSLHDRITSFTRCMKEKSLVRRRTEDSGSLLFASQISSNRDERSRILLIMVEMFLTCVEGDSIEETSLQIWIRDSSRGPVGNNPELAIRVGGGRAPPFSLFRLQSISENSSVHC